MMNICELTCWFCQHVTILYILLSAIFSAYIFILKNIEKEKFFPSHFEEMEKKAPANWKKCAFWTNKLAWLTICARFLSDFFLK